MLSGPLTILIILFEAMGLVVLSSIVGKKRGHTVLVWPFCFRRGEVDQPFGRCCFPLRP
jgi:hypothetical protein